MGIDLDVIIGYSAPLGEAELLHLPELLVGPVFQKEAEDLLHDVDYPGIRTLAERTEFCSWRWQDLRERRWFWRRRSWSREVQRSLKHGGAPSMRWAGFHVDFHRYCARLTHLERYGAFLGGERYRLPAENGLQRHLRRCCRAVATTFGTRRALYLPDSGDAPVQIARRWATEGASFDAIASRLQTEFGPQPRSLAACTIDDYFIDDLEGLD